MVLSFSRYLYIYMLLISENAENENKVDFFFEMNQAEEG